MIRVRKLWMPVVLGMVLISTVVGVANARPNARPQQQAWRVLTVPAAVCVADPAGYQYTASVSHLQCPFGNCRFLCAVNFPAAGEQAVGAINVKRVTMYAYDNNAGAGLFARVRLYKTYPATGGALEMAVALTGAASAADPWVVMDTTILGNPVFRTQAPVLYLHITGANIRVYGFFIHYTW